jgi:hypothetical protein
MAGDAMTVILDPVVMVDDRSIWPAVTALTNCLCTQIASDGLPPVCICSPMPGDSIATDYVSDDAGMAWVRVVLGWPSTSFPAQSQSAACSAPLAFQLEVGLVYCAPAVSSDGEPPDLPAQFDATRLQLAGMNTMRRALRCCFPGQRGADTVLGNYTPMGPMGGVVGGTWTVFVAEGAI